VYLSWVISAVPVPRWTLVGFQRVTLPLNTPQQLTLTVTARQMAVWIDDATGFAVETGMHQFLSVLQPLFCAGVGYLSFLAKQDDDELQMISIN